MENKRFLSTIQLAKILGVSRITVYKRIKSGKIKAKKVGRNFVIDKADLGSVLGNELSVDEKKEIDAAMRKTFRDYGETLKLLGSA